MHVGAKVLNRCYFTVVAYYACFLTRRPEKNNIFYNETLRSTNLAL